MRPDNARASSHRPTRVTSYPCIIGVEVMSSISAAPRPIATSFDRPAAPELPPTLASLRDALTRAPTPGESLEARESLDVPAKKTGSGAPRNEKSEADACTGGVTWMFRHARRSAQEGHIGTAV